MYTDLTANHNFTTVCSMFGKDITVLVFGTWTTFKRDEITLSEAIAAMVEYNTIAQDWS